MRRMMLFCVAVLAGGVAVADDPPGVKAKSPPTADKPRAFTGSIQVPPEKRDEVLKLLKDKGLKGAYVPEAAAPETVIYRGPKADYETAYDAVQRHLHPEWYAPRGLPRKPADDKGAPAKPADDLKALDGKWACQAVTFDSEEVPADVAKALGYAFADGKLTATGGFAKQGGSYTALDRTVTYAVELGADKTGKTIDLTEDGKKKARTLPGRYKLEKGKLTVILNYKDSDRPEAFESKEGSGTGVFVFEKEEEKKK